MITIAKRFTFDAAHRLSMLPADHKCHRLHGHTYAVELRLFGVPDARGFIADYQDIAEAWAPIHDQLDHRYLNEIVGLEKPSTEALVIWIFDRILRSAVGHLVSSIRVAESESTWAELSAQDYEAFRRSPDIVALVGSR